MDSVRQFVQSVGETALTSESPGSSGGTALPVAAASGHREMVQVLTRSGASVEVWAKGARNGSSLGCSARQLALRVHSPEPWGHCDKVKTLILTIR